MVFSAPYDGNVTFNAKSGKKDRTSIYGTEFHGTSYQYGFGITPESCKDSSRVFARHLPDLEKKLWKIVK